MTTEQRQAFARGFQVIPAVDLLGDEAVRLERGDFDRVNLRAGDPAELVARFVAAGASLIHVVDLGGARSGRIRPGVIGRLARVAGSVPVQASGGIRSTADAAELLAAGARRVIVGTAAFSHARSLERFVNALGEQLVVAVDVRHGRIAVSGWEKITRLTAEEAAERCAAAGVARLHCTAIERDGTMDGPDLALLGRVRDRFGGPVVAAGGVRSEADLAALETVGLEGAVVGRALLEGRVPLAALSRR